MKNGMDGLAGGMTVIGFGCLALLGWLGEHHSIFSISFLTTASAAGFLIWNFPPAKIFMGDVGSTSLGFLAGGLSVLGVYDELFDIWVPIMIFSPFIVDSTVTLFRRLFRREKVWKAHRKHYYQRLVLAGWGHRKTVLVEYVLMAAFAVIALFYQRFGESFQITLLVGTTALYIFLAYFVGRVERQHGRK